jgi:hypothetical protein
MPSKIRNRKTTAFGILLIIGAICTGGAELLSGEADLQMVITAVMAALGGSGFLVSGDGGL